MKRILLVGLVAVALAWISYASYELWINNNNIIRPEHVFCKSDEEVLLVERFQEALASRVFETMDENPLVSQLVEFDSTVFYDGLKIYVSKKRPILIFEKDESWKTPEINAVSVFFSQDQITIRKEANILMIALEYQPCETVEKALFLKNRDKKASANYWKYVDGNWMRTDVYNLKKGMFEYRSSISGDVFGKPIEDIPSFASVTPNGVNSYTFLERFYAITQDSILKRGPMNEWLGEGFVEFNYEGMPVIISDYRSQQTPVLILNEHTKDESTARIDDGIYSFKGFQLTHDFPTKENMRIFLAELEDKFVIAEDKETVRKIVVDYQLGKTLALTPEKQEDFFKGLPSKVNKRVISENRKSSLTWKDGLLFEVNTLPPNQQFSSVVEKNEWTISADITNTNLVTINDHLRKGISSLVYTNGGNYQLIGPNGNEIWKGSTGEKIEGKVHIIDIFDNQKKQFLFRTKSRVYLIDLNGNSVGNFPYRSKAEITSDISEFSWRNTKRFLVGKENGEITMLNTDGKEMKTVSLGTSPIKQTPFAYSVGGNLRAWAINDENQQMLGYLEKSSIMQTLETSDVEFSLKSGGNLINYFSKNNTVYQQVMAMGNSYKQPSLVSEGKLFSVNEKYIIVNRNNLFAVYNHELKLLYSIKLPFNEVGEFVYFDKTNVCFVLDYLQNKIHAFGPTSEELDGFPKEGRNLLVVDYQSTNKLFYVYSTLANSIICYKLVL